MLGGNPTLKANKTESDHIPCSVTAGSHGQKGDGDEEDGLMG